MSCCFPYAARRMLRRQRHRDTETLHVAAAASLLLLHNVSSDCDDTWVQTSRLLPPDNALIALQRQPVGKQGSYCLGFRQEM